MICNLCKKEIDRGKDKYVRVEDWNKFKMERYLWMHLECFNKAMNKDKQEMLEKAERLIDFGSKALGRILPPQQEAYHIK